VVTVLVVHNGTHHADNLMRLCEAIASANADVRLAIVTESRHHARVTRAIGLPGVRLLALGGPARTAATSGPPAAPRGLAHRYLSLRQRLKGTSRFAGRAIDALELNSVACVVRERRVRAHFATQIGQVQRLIDEEQPDVMVAVSDRNPDLDSAALLAARSRGVKVLLPYVGFSGSGGMLWSRRLYGPRRWTPPSLYRAVRTRQLPPATIREGFLFQEPHVMAAMHRLGILSANPWCIGAGLSDVVCVDAEATAQRYVAEGVPAAKLRIVGSPEFDELYRGLQARAEMRARIAQECGWSPSRKLIVLALPQFAEQGVMDWDRHWKEIRYLVGELTRTDHSVLISLHPRVDLQAYTFLEQEFDARISRDPLKVVLPAADTFVAVNSSTLVWAVLCGIPTFLLDFYGLDSSEFAKFQSVHLLKDRGRVRSDLLEAVQSRPNFSRDWELLSRDAVFDGHAVHRYVDLMRCLAESRGARV
jgi:hypothetical protein